MFCSSPFRPDGVAGLSWMLIIKVGGEALTMLKSEYGASYGLSSSHFLTGIEFVSEEAHVMLA